jgi:hypothetical protein
MSAKPAQREIRGKKKRLKVFWRIDSAAYFSS